MALASDALTYHDLFQRLTDAVMILDPHDFVIREANPACERVLGWGGLSTLRHEQMGILTECWNDFERYLRVARRRYHPVSFETKWRHPDGRILILGAQLCSLETQDGQQVIQFSAHDLTEFRRAQERQKEFLAELKLANAKLERLASHDALTGLPHRRSLLAEGKLERERAIRYETEFSMIFCDIDHFKKLNDEKGHAEGDRVLKKVAKIIKRECRTTDLPARFGGEEFVILVRGVGAQGSRIFAERLRQKIESETTVTASFGIASFSSRTLSLMGLIKRADQALYKSKERGRNQITVWSPRSQRAEF